MAASRKPSRSQPAAHPVLTIDLDALVRNLEQFRKIAPGRRIYGVIKADAYGLGAAKIATTLAASDINGLCVALPEEAIVVSDALTKQNLQLPMLILNGISPHDVEEIAARNLIPVLNSAVQWDLWASVCRKVEKKLPAVLHIDTGMNRLGMSPEEVANLLAASDHFQAIPLHLVMSHLACADEPEDPLNDRQRKRFEQSISAMPNVPASLANSAGALLGPSYHFDTVRPGIGLYGGAPTATDRTFEPVVRFEAPILQIRKVDKAQTVGYGASYRTNAPVKVATVAAGYADGYMRKLGNCSQGYIGAQRVPVIGRVSMDLLTLDVSKIDPENCRPGTMIELIGNNITINDLAKAADTIPYEILTRLGRRGTRIYSGGPLAKKDISA